MTNDQTHHLALLGKFCRERRKTLGLTQQQLHQATGLSMGWIGSAEAGLEHTPKPETLRKLSGGLVLSVETPGSLWNFFQVLLAGALLDHVVIAVACGIKSAADVLWEATQGHGIRLLLPAETRATRRPSNHDRVMKLLAADLPPPDYELAQILLAHLYRRL